MSANPGPEQGTATSPVLTVTENPPPDIANLLAATAAEEIPDLTDSTPDPSKLAEAVSDEPTDQPTPEEMRERIMAEFANRPPHDATPKTTIADIFNQSVALVAAATGRQRGGFPRVNESSAVKLYELALMWALNNRQGPPSHDIIPPEESGETPEPPEAPPTPNEVIVGTPDTEE